MSDLSATLDMSAVNEFTDLMPKHIFNATRSAISTTTTFTKKELQNQAAKKTKIPLKAFKDYRVFSRTDMTVGRVWFGFNALRARYAGKITDAGDGAFAGDYYFSGRDRYFAAELGAIHSRSGEGTYSIWKRRTKERWDLTEGRVNINNLDTLAAEISESAQAELQARFIGKLREYETRLQNA